MKNMLKTMLWIGVFLGTACEPSQDSPVESRATQKQDLQMQAPDGHQVLSIHPKFGILHGADEPALENADHARVLKVSQRNQGQDVDVLDGLQDAQFLADGSILAVTRSSDLVQISKGEVTVLENDVSGPLSIGGNIVAYRIGEMGEQIPVVRNLLTGERGEAADDVAPAWQLALSESGKEMLFISARTNKTTLIRVSVPSMTVLEETEMQVVPIGPTAPIWRGDVFIFEAEEGLLKFNLPDQTWTKLSGTRPLVATDGRIFVHDNGLRDMSEVVR